MQSVKAPTKEFPHWHFVCACGKPVKPDQAWYVAKLGQVHEQCKPK